MRKNNTTHPDKTDQQIIKKLQTNARKPYRQIAKELNLSVGTITNRIQKLQKTGIIQGFHLELDYAALGYNIQTIIEIDTQKDITNIIQKYPENIITTHKTTGQYNTLLITRFKNITQLNTFLQTLTQHKNINKTNVQLILETKNT